ncbi:MAG: hypothetical protein WKI04_17835 [Ferruginibacter sp.]
MQRIGAACYALGDVASAKRFTQQSIQTLPSGLALPTAYDNYLLKNYSNLVIFYGASNNFHQQRMAVDSCIIIGRRLPIVEESYLLALQKKVEFLFYAGDYTFCFNYASIGEAASRRYDNFNKESFVMNFFSWKINTLISDKKYDAAEVYLLNMLKDTINTGAKEYLGTIYEQLAEVMIYKKDAGKILSYVQKAISYDELYGNNLGCMETLNNLGYYYYFKQLGDNKSPAHIKALRNRNKEQPDHCGRH